MRGGGARMEWYDKEGRKLTRGLKRKIKKWYVSIKLDQTSRAIILNKTFMFFLSIIIEYFALNTTFSSLTFSFIHSALNNPTIVTIYYKLIDVHLSQSSLWLCDLFLCIRTIPIWYILMCFMTDGGVSLKIVSFFYLQTLHICGYIIACIAFLLKLACWSWLVDVFIRVIFIHVLIADQTKLMNWQDVKTCSLDS